MPPKSDISESVINLLLLLLRYHLELVGKTWIDTTLDVIHIYFSTTLTFLKTL